MSRTLTTLTTLLAAILFASPVFAQDVKTEEKDKQEKEETKKDEPKKNPDVEKYEKAIKDLEKFEGPFTIYKKKNDILLELPESDLERLFMAQVSLHSGFTAMMGQAGEPIAPGPIEVFKWRRSGEKLLLVRPRTKYRWEEDDPLAIASARTFPEAILGSFRIEQKHPEKNLLLVNVTSFFQGGVFRLSRLVSSGAGGAASLDREQTGIDKIKQYDKNSVIRMNVHFRSQGGGEMAALLAALGFGMPNHLEDGRSIPFKVTYNLWYREEDDYLPRLADPRIGYFTQDHFNASRFYEFDHKDRYIARFDLRKKNPTAKMSEPVEPVVWYIDTSVPKSYRPAVRTGILAWNAAFEKIGYKNAVVVRDAPENDPDWDHADGMHNVIRWNMSESTAYAVAWFRLDPLSGKVLNASISIDANFAAVMLREFDYTIKQSTAEIAELSRKAILRTRPGEQDALQLLMSGENPRVAKLQNELDELGWNRARCEYAEDLAFSAARGWAILKSNGAKIAEKDYMDSFLADLVMHEVGHCFGLRHNFAGSTQMSVSDLLDDDKARTFGISASVMDYAPVNTPAVLRGSGVFFNEVLGPYDNWAIEYGYTSIMATKPEDEKFELGLIAKQSGEAVHLFLTDEDADGINPLAVKFDLGSDTIEWLKTEVEGNRSVREFAINKMTKVGEGYGLRNRLILSSFVRDIRSSQMASRFIGGLEMRRQHRGDLNEQPTLKPVSPEKQRKAMKFIIENTIMLDHVDLPLHIKQSLSMDPNDQAGSFWTAPLRAIVGGNQIGMLSSLMGARRADYIIENQFKLEGQDDVYTLTEHYNMLFAAVFKEVGLKQDVTAMRRDLQRFMIDSLVMQASAPGGFVSEDLRTIASQALVRLRTRFVAQAKDSDGLDEMTVLHLKDAADRIDRYLKRIVTDDR